jgi:hypothetical protein
MKRRLAVIVLSLGLAMGVSVQGGAAEGFQGGGADATGATGAETTLPGVDGQTTNSTRGNAGVSGSVDNCGADTSMQGTGTAGSWGVAGIGASGTAGATAELDNC